MKSTSVALQFYPSPPIPSLNLRKIFKTGFNYGVFHLAGGFLSVSTTVWEINFNCSVRKARKGMFLVLSIWSRAHQSLPSICLTKWLFFSVSFFNWTILGCRLIIKSLRSIKMLHPGNLCFTQVANSVVLA